MPKNPPPKKYLPHGVKILYEDNDLLFIEKPAGLLSAPAHYEKEKNALTLMTNFIRKGQKNSRKNLFCVNRLDRETSGVLAFAKSYEFRELMHLDWRDNEKIYIAVVAGNLRDDAGFFESWLVANDDYTMRSSGVAGQGKLAQTRYTVLRRGKGWTCVCAELMTGVKNQIRVQFSEAGNPLLGDKMYGKIPAPRLALHAWRLIFTHPRTRERIKVESGVPTFFEHYLAPPQT
ncbi:MAG: RluA family pseudouridine synthase [Opitutae bacterium]|nr:RluA family pseudouridine synthase [Opitutae bacterium]